MFPQIIRTPNMYQGFLEKKGAAYQQVFMVINSSKQHSHWTLMELSKSKEI